LQRPCFHRPSECRSRMEDQWQKTRIYLWGSQDVTAFLSAQNTDILQYATIAEAKAVDGSQLLGADETYLKLLLNCSARHAHDIFQRVREIRMVEFSSYPRPSSQVAAKIDICKRTNTMALNDMKLVRFPDIVCDMIHIVNLAFTGNQIRILPPEIGLMTRLTSLKGGRNRLIALPESFGFLISLQMVFLEANALCALPDSMMFCSALKILDVSQNRIEMLPLSLFRCTCLSKLNLYDNPLILPKEVTDRGAKSVLHILAALYRAQQTHCLDLSNTLLLNTPKLALIHSLTDLKLDSNMLKRVNGLHVLCNLISLSFTENKIERIPLNFCMLTNLRTLNFERNPISFPPPCAMGLKTKEIQLFLKAHIHLLIERTRDFFEAFDEDRSGLISKNEFIAGLYKVDLKLSQNEILNVLGEHDQDSDGSISFSELKEFLSAIALSEARDGVMFTNALDLSSLGLICYDIALDDPCEIHSLMLHNNKIEILPENLFRFENLQSLDLDQNKIQDFPPPIGNLSTLRRLSMRDNLINLIPPWLFTSITRLHLEELYLENNALTSLPCDMVCFRVLKQLGLKGNPLANPLKKLLEVGPEFVIGYLNLFFNSKLSGILDLSGMNLDKVPDEADFRPILTCLVARNALRELPSSLSSADNLVVLDFSDNYIEQVYFTSTGFLKYLLVNINLLLYCCPLAIVL
jgi:leucine-rich repeat protein SHOC2